MTSHALSRQHALFLAGGSSGRRTDRLRKTLIISLILHVCVLALIAGFRFKKNVERPLSAVQVSLVTAPVQETKPEPRVEKVKPMSKPVQQSAPIPVPPKPQSQPTPAPAQSKPAPTQAKPAPAPSPPPPVAPDPVVSPPVSVQPVVPVKPAPTLVQPSSAAPTLRLPPPIPQSVKSSPAAPIRSKREVMEDLLKDIELPPNAPQFGDLAPPKPVETKRPIQAKFERPQERVPNEIDQMLKKLKVPEKMPEKMAEIAPPPPVELPKEQAKPMPVPPKIAPSLSEEFNRELKELKPIQAPPAVKLPEPVKESRPMFEKPPVQQQATQQQPPPVTASVPKAQKVPDTKLKVLSGSSSGANAYLALVQRAVNEKWTAPPVDISGAALTVVIKFHLSRSGLISGVEFKQQSGNGWYDDAARRAVMSVERLPPFPPHITEQSYDIYFSFAVGEGAG
ncbi:MAG TPA: TonB C-terminal domain-containing protein [Nitrospiraceae bacterium]|nr:TonB C-terminal domain-containing protein [Nitrospiraceae bacterium]